MHSTQADLAGSGPLDDDDDDDDQDDRDTDWDDDDDDFDSDFFQELEDAARPSRKWPTAEELVVLQEIENKRAEEADDEANPICECGESGFACVCDQYNWYE